MKKEDLKKLADLLNEYIVYECLKWENKIDYFQNEGVVVRSMNCDKKKNVGLSMKIKNLSYNEQGLGKIHNAAAAKASIKK